MIRRVVILGASGGFGRRLAARLALWPDTDLVLCGRRAAPLDALRASLIAQGAPAPISVVTLDRRAPGELGALSPWAVIDAAGPFQDAGYDLAQAALSVGAHYLDLADGRGFVGAFAGALDVEAKRADRLAATGASTSPTLTAAAVERLTGAWRRIDRIEAVISPGAKAIGPSVIGAALTWAGQPVRVFQGGAWRTRAGASLLRRRDLPGLGARLASLAETPDLDLLPEWFAVRDEALFLAGAELGSETIVLAGLAWLVRLRLMRSLQPLAPMLGFLAARLTGFAADRGGVSISVDGEGPDGMPALARWSLAAAPGIGPYVPILPVLAILRALKDGPGLSPGARPAAGLVSLDDILSEAMGLDLRTRTDQAAPSDPSLARRTMGGVFDGMPAAVRAVHAGVAPAQFHGVANARGQGGLAALARLVAGLPGPGRYPHLTVEIVPDAAGERWTRRFGAVPFSTRLRSAPAIGRFQERIGPLAFLFDADPYSQGFRWRFAGWRLGPLPLPRALAPRIHARSFARNGAYQFSVAMAMPLIGLVFAYAGRLDVPQPGPQITSTTLRSRRRASAARP